MTAGGNSLFALQAPRFLAIFSIVTLSEAAEFGGGMSPIEAQKLP